MISVEDALSEILARANPLPAHEAVFGEAVGRVLAAPLHASVDSPRFMCSAVDGFGVRVKDAPGTLPLIGCVPAGEPSRGKFVGAGKCVRILTGAPIPSGVEAVVMQEFCTVKGDSVRINCHTHAGENIRMRGEEFSAGELLVPAGVPVTSGIIGLAAGNGLESLTVHRRPRIGIIATGNELASAGDSLTKSQIYDSNTGSLWAASAALAECAFRKRVGDDVEATRSMVGPALEQCDVLLFAGGICGGERDWVRQALVEEGVHESFWGVAMKPGRGIFFGTKNGRLVFGLPGNPVAALAAFHLFVRPALRSLSGLSKPQNLRVPVRLSLARTKTLGRAEYVRANLVNDGQVLWAVPTCGQGSHMLSGIAMADCLLELRADASSFEKGDSVQALPLEGWSLL